MNTNNAINKYADIIALPHRQSATRKHMSLYDRAAQFAPFAALSGYDDMVVEEARLTDTEIELSDFEIDELNRKITLLEEELTQGDHPKISVTFFKPDSHKAGGKYETISGFLKKIDLTESRILLFGSDNIEDKRIAPLEIMIDKIIKINGKSFEET